MTTFLLAKNYYWSFLLLFVLLLSTKCSGNSNNINISRNQKVSNKSFEAIFVFGDSTVDPGNNNNIKTLFKSDFPPYGVDFPEQRPTGRFCNGRLATDFIASYLGIKQSIPAYLEPALSFNDLITGVSFASAGSGYDPITVVRNSVISMWTQLKYFDEYRKTMESKVGKKRMKKLLKKSVFVVSCGTNDLIYTYGIVETPIDPYTVPGYLSFILEQSKLFIQGLIERGAEKIGIVSLPPTGCLPALVTVHSVDKQRKCVESLSAMARNYNQMQQNQLKTLQASLPQITLVHCDIYTPLQDQINHPQKYGLEEVSKGCCGTGSIEASILCNSLTSVICNDRSKYVFWDSIHPTETSYSFVFEALRPLIDLIVGRL